MNPKAIGDKKNGAKARQPGFYLKTTILTKLMRRVCKDQLPRRSGALSPFKNLEIDGIKVKNENHMKKIYKNFRKFVKRDWQKNQKLAKCEKEILKK